MVDFDVKSKKMNIGNRKGQTVYFAQPKTQQHLTNRMLIERIVRETSLSQGDVSNALISLSNVINDALQMGMSVDLAELGYIRPIFPSKMMDTPEEVTVDKALKNPKIVFTPKKKMRLALNAVTRSIDRSSLTKADAGTGTTPAPDEGNTGGSTGGGSEDGDNPIG